MAAGELWVPTSGTSLRFRDHNNVIRAIPASGTALYVSTSGRVLSTETPGSIGFQASTERLYWNTNTDSLGIRIVAWRDPDFIGMGGTVWGPAGAIAVMQYLTYPVIAVVSQASPFRFIMYIGT